MLVPAMLLVLLCLGSIAIDMSLVHGAHRSTHRIASAAADDAAAMIDTTYLQQTGELRIDPASARRMAIAQVAAMDPPGSPVGPPTVAVDPSGAVVTVTLTVDVDHVMLRAVPGHADRERLRVTAQARLNR